MVCDGPDPPENNPHELSPPPRHDLLMNGPQLEDSDDENEYVGYEPLPQGPEISYSDQDLEEDDQVAIANSLTHILAKLSFMFHGFVSS